MLSAATAARNPAATRLQVAVVRMLEIFVFVGLPLINAAVFGRWVLRADGLFDFRTFWQAGHEVLHGHSPYPAVIPRVANPHTFRPFVYPAPAAFFLAPFALLPWLVAEGVWVVLGIAAVAATLWLLDVRDWRCYGVIFLWPAIWSALANGSVSLVLLCACAALWRYRFRPFVAGALLAVLVVFKLYLWPLAVWLLVTRRVQATVVSVAVGGASALAGWALIGFAGLRQYPHLLDRLTSLVADNSYSPYALFRSLGAGHGSARLAMLACGAAVLVAVVRARNEDARSFLYAICATFVLSPIVWPHYFVLIAVVVAVASREFDYGWLLPIPAWVATTAWSSGSTVKIAIALAIYGGTMVWALQKTGRSRVAPARRPATPQPAVK